MKKRVVIVPSDGLVIVDNEHLLMELPPDLVYGLQALQWENELGHLEFSGQTPNYDLTAQDYIREVQPFVDLFEAEKARLKSRPDDFSKWDERSGQWVPDQAAINEHRHNEILLAIGQLRETSIDPMLEALVLLVNQEPVPVEIADSLNDSLDNLKRLKQEALELSKGKG